MPVLACPAQEPEAPLGFNERLNVFQKSLVGPVPVAGSVVIAGIQQWRDSPDEWGQGMAGYGRRLAHRAGVGVAANSIRFGVAALISEDPRYFSAGGTTLARIGHAVKGTFLARTDDGGSRFAWARVAGAFGGAVVSNAWCPVRDRTAGNTLQRAGLAIAGDAAANALQEFWPAIRRKVFKR